MTSAAGEHRKDAAGAEGSNQPALPALHSANPPRVCTIAGSDSGGGAGIQADLKTIQALGGYGLSVITALTAQNTTGVQAVHAPPSEFVRSQLASVHSDIRIDAWKIGMLANKEIIQVLSEDLTRYRKGKGKLAALVLDPVMVSTSGSLLLTHDSIHHLISGMLPLCDVLTPNLPEARQLLAHARNRPVRHDSATAASPTQKTKESGDDLESSLDTLKSLLSAAKELSDLGPKATLVKGGHHVMKKSEVNASLLELGGGLGSAPESQDQLYTGIQSRGQRYRGQLSGTAEADELCVVRTDGSPWSDVLSAWYASGSSKSTSSHDVESVIVDVLYEKVGVNGGPRYTLFVKPHVQSTATHGTGCTLSSAIATYLSSGLTIERAVSNGISYVQASIARGLESLGQGAGPLNHACTIAPRGVLPPVRHADSLPSDRTPLCAALIANNISDWNLFVQHPFVEKLSCNELSKENFVWFLRQDYLFLLHYSRVWASGASSAAAARTFDDVVLFAGMAASMATEAKTHTKICAAWSITEEDLQRRTKESAATLAYTRYVLDVSRSGDALELLCATGPCMLGYAEVGLRLGRLRKRTSVADFPENAQAFGEWIDTYADEGFQDVARKSIEAMEDRAAADFPSQERMKQLQNIWNAAVRLEIGMWDEAIDANLRREIVDAPRI
ncbi:Phosphomethylpyrimidine kinase [Ceraceosorus bombacis]|uniref:Phosphomethylpyrimidine kinase n=1 Tax=Ceraceosorus bombacis TaxID=401625 RepID=A0A0P1BB26_9BASI|nr:Phosphomethylpyrimidine kinase [Ceraceosorus bombacis]